MGENGRAEKRWWKENSSNQPNLLWMGRRSGWKGLKCHQSVTLASWNLGRKSSKGLQQSSDRWKLDSNLAARVTQNMYSFFMLIFGLNKLVFCYVFIFHGICRTHILPPNWSIAPKSVSLPICQNCAGILRRVLKELGTSMRRRVSGRYYRRM